MWIVLVQLTGNGGNPAESSLAETSELLVPILAWVAAQESGRRSERIKTGLACKKAQGGHLGRRAGAKDKTKRSNAGCIERRKRNEPPADSELRRLWRLAKDRWVVPCLYSPDVHDAYQGREDPLHLPHAMHRCN